MTRFKRKQKGLTGANVDAQGNSGAELEDNSDATVTSRNTPPPGGIDHDAIRAKVKRSYDLVPAIGTRWRWYDIPYRFLKWTSSSWRKRLLPWRVRNRLNRMLNFFIPFAYYGRLKVAPREDPAENLIVPGDDNVTQGGILGCGLLSTKLVRIAPAGT